MISLRATVFLLCSISLVKAFSSSSCLRVGVRDRIDDSRLSSHILCVTPSEKSNDIKPVVPILGTDIDLSSEFESIGTRFLEEAKEVIACLQIVSSSLLISVKEVKVEDIVKLCDELDTLEIKDELFVSRNLQLRHKAMEFQRYELLVSLMKSDYDAYVATAGFLSPSRIPRLQLPNLQDVPYNIEPSSVSRTVPMTTLKGDDGTSLVADCELNKLKFNESPLDKLLLKIFRGLVEKNTGGVKSDKPGIDGLLEQGRTFMLREGQTPEAQHKMVSDTLGGLMTPVLPPFYRIFMSGIVPKLGSDLDGKQFGPWFYAPFLTSVVTPTFFGFLVGPSYPNRRKDGQPGGLVVEKCKFLQESGCKGLCLHQCKLPAQQFFKEELGLPLTVSPNFVTQECQWSFGEEPLPPIKDPSFPKGCLVGCESRKAMAGRIADVCN
jgi:Beta-carotene isomerase D27-like, C-terminal